MGSPLPDILYDGSVDPAKAVNGALPENLAIRIRDNGNAGFANFHAASLDAAATTASGEKATNRRSLASLKPYDGKVPPLAPVSIEGVK